MDFEIAVTDAILVTDTASRHYGFPRMVRACNRDLLLFYRAGTTHAYDDAVIEMRRSTDDGASWSGARILRRCEAGFSAHNPVAIVTASGRVILWASRYQYGPNLRHPCWWSTSDDNGATWSEWTVFDPSQQHSCYYITDVIHTSEGILASDATFPPSGQGACHTRIQFSADDGLTWAWRSNLTSPASNLGDEAALMETEPGRILCIQRDRQRADSFRLWSGDGGRTWSARESIREMLDCTLQRPFLTHLGETAYLLSGRDFERKLTVVYLSVDGGQTFGERLEVDSHQKDGAYTSAIRLDSPRLDSPRLGSTECLIAWYSDSHTRPLLPDIKMAKVIGKNRLEDERSDRP